MFQKALAGFKGFQKTLKGLSIYLTTSKMFFLPLKCQLGAFQSISGSAEHLKHFKTFMMFHSGKIPKHFIVSKHI
jgi:hypothetical protein